MTHRETHYCGAPTSAGTRRYDPSGTCRNRVKAEGELCTRHQRQQQMAADRHE